MQLSLPPAAVSTAAARGFGLGLVQLSFQGVTDRYRQRLLNLVRDERYYPDRVGPG